MKKNRFVTTEDVAVEIIDEINGSNDSETIQEILIQVKSGNPYRQKGGKFGNAPAADTSDQIQPSTSETFQKPTLNPAGGTDFMSAYDAKNNRYVRMGDHVNADKIDFAKTDSDTELDILFDKSKKRIAELSPEQLEALESYTSEYGLDSYKNIIQYARDGKLPNMSAAELSHIETNLNLINESIDSKLGAKYVLSRGVETKFITDKKLKTALDKASRSNFSQMEIIAQRLSGYDFSDPAPNSTSYMNSQLGFGQRAISLRIVTDRNTKGLYIDPVSKYAGKSSNLTFLGVPKAEGEVLLHPSNKFKVAGFSFSAVDRKRSRTNIYLIPVDHKYLSVKKVGSKRVYTYLDSDGDKYTISTE